MIRDLAKKAVKPLLQRTSGGRILWRGPSDVRRVALTFDDGPHELTGRTLKLLGELGVPATFFLLGAAVSECPDDVRRYLRGGHQVASHGYTHQRFTKLQPGELRAELADTERVIGPTPTPGWVRPPHGSISPLDISTLLVCGYTVAMWSLDSNDHDHLSAAEIADRCSPDKVRPGEVLLFHEGEPETLAALPTIIERIHADGYEITTMADLFVR